MLKPTGTKPTTVSGVLALAVTWVVYDAVVNTLQNQVALLSIIGMGNIIQFGEIGMPVAASYILGGALIGAVGSAISTRKYINV